MIQKYIFILLLVSFSTNAQILDAYPEHQDFYEAGTAQLYHNFHQVILDKKIEPCQNKDEIYKVKLLLTKEAQIKFIKDFDSVNIAKNKCAYDLSLNVLKSLKTNWNPAVVKDHKFDSVVEFFVFPNDLFENYKDNYDHSQFYQPAHYKGGKEKFHKEFHDFIC